MSRKFLILFLSATLFTACGVDDDKVLIKGDFENINQAEFYVYAEGDAFTRIDTIRVDNGKFRHELPLRQKEVLTLLYPNYSRTQFVGEPGATIRISGDASHLSNVEVVGTEENVLLTNFRLSNAERDRKDKAMAVADFIRSHAKTTAAIAVWREAFTHCSSPGLDADQLLGVMLQAQPDNQSLKHLSEQVGALTKVIEGTELPDFSATTLAGKEIKKSDFAGKPLVIAFWANWQNDSPMLITELLSYKREHINHARFIHISLDPSEENARRMLRDDTAALLICDEQMFESPLVRLFGVRSVPSTIIVDKDGKVAARDLPLKKIREQLKEM